MIITFTPNPSIDSTLALREELVRGTVQRLDSVTAVAGGKGINVAHAVLLAGFETLAIFPAGKLDPFVPLVREIGLPCDSVVVSTNVRTNTTVTEPDGTTTKLNGPGAFLSEPKLRSLEKMLVNALVPEVTWVVLAGSLPPGAPVDWYPRLTALIHAARPDVRVAVDTSDQPLLELGKKLDEPGAAPNLIKPNGLELGQLANVDGEELEALALKGDYTAIIDAAEVLVQRGVEQVLVTLGPAGAVLVNADGAWTSTTPAIDVVSTVGAGDCALAGFVMARSQKKSIEESLLNAVSYGSAAAALPGTTIPRPDQLTYGGAKVTLVKDLKESA
ncbi:fructose-1-phosphate kinase [Corynebacterium deserti GIMN1.010]|uniref:Fructose-1-phosphate kinase n=1 Tax=Corynebacterium deserti GIMN1.010 TaxID=931089 RepID=A0A0M3Q9S8_9CORY|nr:1-phosphofructokinase family hexose kinase [Corynebacterium deserti]ALC06123.1 fructose-1-phosphate kinase [Corynebacterium deserti GIMN1.010]